jgi:hypothetical protein
VAASDTIVAAPAADVWAARPLHDRSGSASSASDMSGAEEEGLYGWWFLSASPPPPAALYSAGLSWFHVSHQEDTQERARLALPFA